MTHRSDIAAADGSQLGRSRLLSRAELGTLTNAARTIRTLGDVPLAYNLDALRARLADSYGGTGADTCGHKGCILAIGHLGDCVPDAVIDQLARQRAIEKASGEMTEQRVVAYAGGVSAE